MAAYAANNDYGNGFTAANWQAAADYLGMSVDDVKRSFEALSPKTAAEPKSYATVLKEKGMTPSEFGAYAASLGYGVGLSPAQLREVARDLGTTTAAASAILDLAKNANK
jgi:hypothetical protein